MKNLKEWINLVLLPIFLGLVALGWHDIKAHIDLSAATQLNQITTGFVGKPEFTATIDELKASDSKQWEAIQKATTTAQNVATTAASAQNDINMKLQHLVDTLDGKQNNKGQQ